MSSDIRDSIVKKNGFNVFVAPKDGEITMNNVEEWDGEARPIGWGNSVAVSEGDEIVIGFTGESDE